MPLLPSLTPMPDPPNVGSPATFPSLASAFVAAQVTLAEEINTFIDGFNAINFSSLFATYGGTADAIALTTGAELASYVTGMEIRFRATSANTGAATINVDGLGAKTLKTVTGAALPAGYIRTGIDTVIRYDGTDFIASRAVEKGSNSNGRYTRLEDGTQFCSFLKIHDAGSNVASYTANWTFPVAFAAAPEVSSHVRRVFQAGVGDATAYITGNSSVVPAEGITATQLGFLVVRTSGTMQYIEASLTAIGDWY